MAADRLLRIIVAAVAAHSLVIGVAMWSFPLRVLTLINWPYDGSRFFPAQTGAFMVILGLIYLGGLVWRPAVWFLVLSKTIAVIFLLGEYARNSQPAIIPPLAAVDGLMGLIVAIICWRATRGRVPGRQQSG